MKLLPELPANDRDGENRLLRLIIPGFSTFNIYSFTADKTTALGPIYIGTMVRDHTTWDVEIIDENNFHEKAFKSPSGLPDHEKLQNDWPADAIGLYGGLTSTIPRLYELAQFYGSTDTIVFAGGQHFAQENMADALENGVDFLVLGEGEQTVLELIQALEADEDLELVPGLAFMDEETLIETDERVPITDFSHLPMPDFSLLYGAKVTLYPVSWVRGCGMNCEFCTVKGLPRAPCSDFAFDQFRTYHEKYGAREFFLVDDLFGQRRKSTLELCKHLADYQRDEGVEFIITVQIRWDRGKDTELLAAMRACNIRYACIGFESPIPAELKAMQKSVKPEEMVQYTRKFHDAGFHIHGMFISGYPLINPPETTVLLKDKIKAYQSFIRDAKIDTIQILLPVPLPGTDLTLRLREVSAVYDEKILDWQYYDGNFPLIEPDGLDSAQDMQNATKTIMSRFYNFGQLWRICFYTLLAPLVWVNPFHRRQLWQRWFRRWNNACLRFGGWFVMQRWLHAFRKGHFTEHLLRAQAHRQHVLDEQH